MLVGSVLFGADDVVSSLVANRLNQPNGFGPCTALGIVKNEQLVGGVVYHEFTGFSIGVSAYCADPRWAKPQTLHALFYYPFVTLGCVRIEAMISRKNRRARKFIKHLGFTEEGCHPKRYDGKDDAISYGMLKEQCRWLGSY